MEIIIVLGVIALVIAFLVVQYNRLIRLNVAVDESFAQIEVQLKRRADLIPNLVETVKGYAEHEKSTFDAVVSARAKATSATSLTDVAAADGMLTQALRGLLAVAEAYPDLKASANFLSLQDELSNVANLPVKLFPGMKIGQLCLIKLSSPAEHPYGSEKYGSRYQGQRGPTASRSFKNFHRSQIK